MFIFKILVKNYFNKEGFTLVELLIVIAILGILALIAVPKMGGFLSDAQVAADQATVKTIENAVIMAEAMGYHVERAGSNPKESDINKYLDGVEVLVIGESWGEETSHSEKWVIKFNDEGELYSIWPPGDNNEPIWFLNE